MTVPLSREAALASATVAAAHRIAQPANTCARWVRTMYGLEALGDYDGDGAADAEDMLKAAASLHAGDRHPPAGVPVYWTGGSNDNGHIAIAVGNGTIRTTDLPEGGRIGTVGLGEVERRWGLKYAGWSDDLYGNVIPSEAAIERARLEQLRDRLRDHRQRITARLARIRQTLRRSTPR